MSDQRFEIRQLLGEGGTARVYRAWDRTHRREVALKIPFRDAIPPERLRREASAATRLVHPHIVRTHELVDLPDGPALVMELVPGESLRARLDREGKLSVQDTVSLLGQVLSALEYAHANGVVHRDLCPRNLLLEGGHVRITDFGIARVQEEHTLTQTREIMGSVKYFAPEQAMGGRVGPPADLYAVGVLGFEMLTGRTPFDGDNPVQVALKHVNEAPPSVPGVPRELDAVLQRAMSKDPAQRFASAAEMATALRRATDLDRTLTRPPGWIAPAPAARPTPPMAADRPELVGARERRFSVAPLVALLVLLFGGLAFMVALGGRADEPEAERTAFARRRIPTPVQTSTRRVQTTEVQAAPAPMEVLEPATRPTPAPVVQTPDPEVLVEQAQEQVLEQQAEAQPEKQAEKEARRAEKEAEKAQKQAEKAEPPVEAVVETVVEPPADTPVAEPPPEEQADLEPAPVEEFTPDPLPEETFLPSQPPQPDVTFTPTLRGDAGAPAEAALAPSPNAP